MGAIIIFALHVIFPEAVLFSKEQILRVQKMYKFALVEKNIISGIGINTINNYLDDVLKLIVKDETLS